MSRNDLAKILGGSTFILCCRLAGAVFAFATQILLARWMGATELGIYVLAFSACILLATVMGLGYPNAALRIIGAALADNDRAIISGFVRSSMRTILLTGSLVAAIATIVAVSSDVIAPTFLIAAFCVPFFALMRFQCGVAHSHSWFPLSYIPNNVLRPGLLLVVVSGLWLANVGLHASTVIGAHLAVIVLVVSSQQFFLRRRLRPSFQGVTPKYDRRGWTRISMPMMVTVLMNAYFPELAVMLMGLYVETDQVAVFNASFRIAVLISFGVMAVDGIVMPRVARLYAEGNIEGLQTVISRATLLKMTGSIIGVAIVFFFGKDILGLFGDEFVIGYTTMLILAVSQMVIAMMGAGAGILSVTGHQDSCLKVFFYALVLFLILNMVLVPMFGMQGAAVAILSVVIVRHLWLNLLVAQKIGVRPSILASHNAFPFRNAESAL